jgi:hypothetical protein
MASCRPSALLPSSRPAPSRSGILQGKLEEIPAWGYAALALWLALVAGFWWWFRGAGRRR